MSINRMRFRLVWPTELIEMGLLFREVRSYLTQIYCIPGNMDTACKLIE